MQTKILGLIAGNGKFPILFAQKAKSQNYKVIAAGIKGDTSFLLKYFVSEYSLFKAGELKKLFSFFKDKGVTHAIMAGQVSQRNLFKNDVVFDEDFQAIFDSLKDRKADTIFSAIADKLKENGIELVDSTFLLKDCLASKGVLTDRKPDHEELEDIEFGKEIAKRMGAVDVGQTVVIKRKAIVAIEAMEGTDKTIYRGGKIAKTGAVIVKMSKPNQDLRFDVPVIGPRTIAIMKKCSASCLAIESGKTLIIDKDICLKMANSAGICIVSV
ncbi:MAG: UDP-2,3-diacylglucosamine diphosphatase LpxI [Candidatus Omnitrophica bacterium]|nr:UDP-2,3-diacylglucosamine diphosphatase LpxI [Candidatus Omnitrophota bacterium]MBU4334378.1 UDP-2,3-diacylglucosamine diphosphatase LpxI [Candidatus Omnitrophota bacterium]